MIIPHLFSKRAIPDELPASLQKVVDSLKKTKSKRQCLEKAFTLLTKKYHGKKWLTYTRFPDLFRCTVKSIWNRKGFLHCTNFNYILRVVLIKSGKFTESDIKQKITFLAFYAIHQYLRIRVGKNKFIDVDPWGEAYGIPLGKHTSRVTVLGKPKD